MPKYVNDFTQYSKFRNNSNFLSSEKYIFVTPEIGKNAIDLETFYVLKFNKIDASLASFEIPKVDNLVDCATIKTISDFQYNIISSGKKILVQFGVDKNQSFCICKSKVIAEHFYCQYIKNYKQKNIYIGNDYQTKSTKVYFD